MKFVLVSTARAGSSYAVRNLANKLGIKFHYDEILNTKRKYEFFEEFSKGSVYVKNNKIMKLLSNKDNFYENQLQSWLKSDVVSCKILAHQIIESPDHIIKGILEEADTIAYLYRKDSTAQVYSAIISKKLKQYNHKRRLESDQKTFVNINQEEFDNQSHDLLNNNLYIKNLLDIYPGKVYCLEDDFDHKPYADIYDYDKSFNYNLQNIEEIFK
tara:strand:- start:278 stop:919 length:642 start_codon:yes stop_codon:yes gene_type:complete